MNVRTKTYWIYIIALVLIATLWIVWIQWDFASNSVQNKVFSFDQASFHKEITNEPTGGHLAPTPKIPPDVPVRVPEPGKRFQHYSKYPEINLLPAPAQIRIEKTHVYLSERLCFVSLLECDIIDRALYRYWNLIFLPEVFGDYELDLDSKDVLLNVKIEIHDKNCPRYPSLEADESYNIQITNRTAVISAQSVWGVLRGLETFSQLVHADKDERLVVPNCKIHDKPRFKHRGFLIDSARHFIPVKYIEKHLDIMSQSKFNVLHWHLSDNQSFPYVSKVFPLLSQVSAYSPERVYSQKDIAEVIEYARERGIRVIPEFDSPSHTMSWVSLYKNDQGETVPGPRTKCNGRLNGTYGPFDPTQNSTYDIMRKFLAEITSVFPDKNVHLGGDEVKFDCWVSRQDMLEFVKNNSIGSIRRLHAYYTERLGNITTNDMNRSLDYTVWQEAYDSGAKLGENAIVQFWKHWTSPWSRQAQRVTQRGIRAISSLNWYLDNVQSKDDWRKFYQFDPRDFPGTDEQKQLILGGEACLWSEWVDTTNFISRAWPRALAIAERLWSERAVSSNATEFSGRLAKQRCRLLARGYDAQPATGPGWCALEWDGEEKKTVTHSRCVKCPC